MLSFFVYIFTITLPVARILIVNKLLFLFRMSGRHSKYAVLDVVKFS
jgi:hypothetical protein